MTEALNSIAAANSKFKKTQKELRNNMQRISGGFNQKWLYRGFLRSRGNSNNNNYKDKTQMLTNSTRIEEVGLIKDNRHNAFKVPTEEEITCFVTDVDNQDIKEVTAGFDGYQNVGQTSHSTETTVQKTEKTTLSNGYCPSM